MSFPEVLEIISLAIFALWIATIAEVVVSKFPKPGDKTMWILVIVLLGIIGCVIYFFMGRKKRIKNEPSATNGSDSSLS